jgi:multiple sugar transport system permease protein
VASESTVPLRAAARRGRSGGRKRTSQWPIALLFMLPSLLLFGVFTIGTILSSFVISMWNWDGITAHRFIGLDNYTALVHDHVFWSSLIVTATYALITIPMSLALGLAIAMALNTKLRGRSFFRFIYFIPFVAPLTSVSVLFRWVYSGQYGILNYLLSFLVPGDVTIDWLHDTSTRLFAIGTMDVWKNLGWTVTLFTAGLLAIPRQYYEAAEIDGATGWSRFRHITFPLVTPTAFFLLVTSLINAFQVFDAIYLMLGDNPGDSATTYNFYVWQEFFRYHTLGYASALAWVLFAIIGVITYLQFRFLQRRVNYEQ